MNSVYDLTNNQQIGVQPIAEPNLAKILPDPDIGQNFRPTAQRTQCDDARLRGARAVARDSASPQE